MRQLIYQVLIASFILTVIACGKGEHMPLPAAASGAQNKAGHGDGSAVEVMFADVTPIFKRVCANCHAPGGALPNWQDYAVAFAKKDRLYDRLIVKKDMPLGGGISDEERKLIGKWLSGGALGESVAEQPTPTPEPTTSPVIADPAPAPTATPAEPPQPANGPILTYNKDILPIFEKNCKLCHNADSGLPNWLDYKVAFGKLDQLMDRVVVKKDMPMGLQMTDEDRDLIESWLVSGALQE